MSGSQSDKSLSGRWYTEDQRDPRNWRCLNCWRPFRKIGYPKPAGCPYCGIRQQDGSPRPSQEKKEQEMKK